MGVSLQVLEERSPRTVYVQFRDLQTAAMKIQKLAPTDEKQKKTVDEALEEQCECHR